MKIVYFTHSLRSCWNHGNAHFLRGILGELQSRGHSTLAVEREGNWSLTNLLADHGTAGLAPFAEHYPDLRTRSYAKDSRPEALVDGADLVIVHEWNDSNLVADIGRMRRAGARFTLLFHDTHHRAVSDPEAIRAFDLSGYDGVLAFGEALSEVYRAWGWGSRVWTWHEAADIRVFHPPLVETNRQGLVWIGNWGDGERSAELRTFLLAPARACGLPLDIYGVRYTRDALRMLDTYGARYHGWAANALAPEVFARHLATMHVPRRFYASVLPGIPTIRVFEALACGIPLISAPWQDSEGLFTPGVDYLIARDGRSAERHLRDLIEDAGLRRSLAEHGHQTILARHSCAHRVDELFDILVQLAAPARSIA